MLQRMQPGTPPKTSTLETLPSGSNTPSRLAGWLALKPKRVLTLMLLVTLAGFVAKPLNIDDPLFVWAALHIQAHHADPYSFEVNWLGAQLPMWEVTKNPPLLCYYLAAWGSVFGWSELALHAALLLPTLAAILGTYRLAHKLCKQPLLATVATFFTPVFLVSSTTVMCDIPMLAFWVWVAVCWVEGTALDDQRRMAAAASLMAMAALTKYFGVCLMPLLAAWSLIGRRRIRDWAGWLVIPLVTLAAYQWATSSLYGYGLFSEARDYAGAYRAYSGTIGVKAVVTALAFTGGCLAVGVFFVPILWRQREMVVGALGIVFGAVILCETSPIAGSFAPSFEGLTPPLVAIQTAFWASAGISVLALAVADIFKHRTADSWLLGLWVWGTFLFAAFLNWTVNARSILPMAPPLGILIARRLDQRASAGTVVKRWAFICPLVAGAALAVLVARSDFLLAKAVRETAQKVCAKDSGGDKKLWFQGHWGFQYYMEAAGASAVDLRHPSVKPGDRVALPAFNTNVYPPGSGVIIPGYKVTASGPNWLTTFNPDVGAGFYSSGWGPLPFAFGRVPPQKVVVGVVISPLPAR